MLWRGQETGHSLGRLGLKTHPPARSQREGENPAEKSSPPLEAGLGVGVAPDIPDTARKRHGGTAGKGETQNLASLLLNHTLFRNQQFSIWSESLTHLRLSAPKRGRDMLHHPILI